MTFIASIIAKEGVAMVADSFVTTSGLSISGEDFVDYLKTAKNKKSISISEVANLFQRRASHTRNYADKLFQFGNYSAISTTGAAYINGKEIKDVIKSIAAQMQVDEAVYAAKDIEEILTDFCDRIKHEVLSQLKTTDFPETDFIFSHFNRHKNIPQIFLIRIKSLTVAGHDPSDKEMVTFSERSDLKIVTDGQDAFVDRLIFGSLYRNTSEIKEQFINYILKTLSPKGLKKKEVISEIRDPSFLKDIIQYDAFSINFRELSLQEAVDLAALLIKITMDIQVYTEKIPTVGGLIRLAIIDKDKGFQWIAGDKITPSKII